MSVLPPKPPLSYAEFTWLQRLREAGGIISTPNRLSAEAKAELRWQWEEMFGKSLERGWATVNEIRAIENLNPIEGGDCTPAELVRGRLRSEYRVASLLSKDAREFLWILLAASVWVSVVSP